ncbi:MAG: hypothetical protein EOP56_08290 [Sphingobacteriales bacterium]|nr:MAG: hypothetical protein EOP56_08290 [Sphingobacteriales bacterium]
MNIKVFEFATEAAALQAQTIVDALMGFPAASTPHAVVPYSWDYWKPARTGRWYIDIDSRQVENCAYSLEAITGITTQGGSVVLSLNKQDPPEE